jgi:NADH-quinone oxidoreductase subunit A
MWFHFGSVAMFALVACLFLVAPLVLGKLIRPRTPDAAKGAVYECGEAAFGAGWFNFNPRFYIVGLVFLIFDVEVAFTYPVAAMLKRFVAQGEGLVAVVEIAAFVLVLALGLAYAWRKGDLEWVRASRPDGDQAGSRAP